MVERFRIVAAEKKCYPCFCRFLLTIVFLCLLLLSYSFILQPAFDPQWPIIPKMVWEWQWIRLIRISFKRGTERSILC